MPNHEETLEEKQEAHNPNCFNLRRSDSLALDRDVPDVRKGGCIAMTYDVESLPPVSIVFVFFNEPLSPLLRSIVSVLNRSPARLIKEIILVDDGSTAPWTKEPLEEQLQLYPKVSLRRMPVRQGLMATRTEGARIASASVVVFLDSHIEVQTAWLEPMIARLAGDRKRVVMPIIDTIGADNFVYTAGGLDRVSFTWALSQSGVSRPWSDTEPMVSPAMAGGLFAIDRARFFELGAYDPEMKLYGGEEMEISIRLWSCGSTLEVTPCSRVGHIFRTGEFHHGQVYPVPGHVIIKNKLRACKLWLGDKYFDLCRRNNGRLPPGTTIGDLSWGHEIQQRLKCKNFDWFLENVFPELFIPGDPKHTRAVGAIRNPATNACIDTLGVGLTDGAKVGAHTCHPDVLETGTQTFYITAHNEVRLATADFGKCLDRANANTGLAIYGCHGGGGNQMFRWDETTGHLEDPTQNTCLTVEAAADGRFTLRTEPCASPTNTFQEWRVVPVNK
jgi:polypeptide N-acetylgalactosaminyltransferase